MAHAYIPVESSERAQHVGPMDHLLSPAARVGLLTFCFIALFTFLSLYRLNPPAVVPASAPPEQFSAERAMKYLNVIAQRPHPVGSTEHEAVRDYLLNELSRAGLSPTVQKTVVFRPRTQTPFHAGTMENVMARLPGAANSKPLVLMAHYDSVPTSPGASDDGAGVATLLETLRALRTGPPLKNDIIFLFTDGEETGLLGARAFVNEHPWAKDIGLVLNFEARGHRGPALMFETSDENGWLIKQLALAGASTRTNSLLYEAYRTLPNETDMTIFKRAGYPGLNFAYIDGAARYHTRADSLVQLDHRSLQHHGSYALALARHFGNLDLTNTKAANAVYFDLLGLTVVHYSSTLVIPLTIVALLGFILVTFAGLWKRRLTVRGITFGFVALSLALIGVVAVVALLQFNIWALHRNYRLIVQGTTYNSDLYAISFVAIGVAITAALYIWFRRKTSKENLYAGALIWWAIAMILTTVYAPGGSYLFTLPFLFALLPLGWMLLAQKRERLTAKEIALLLVCAIPGVVLIVPVAGLLFTGLGTSTFASIMILVVLLLGLLLPHLDLITASNRWLLPGIAVLVSLIFILWGTMTSGFTPERPRPENIFYALNADTGKAVWASTDEQLDNWTSEFFAEGLKRGPISDYIPSTSNRFSSGPAPVASLPAPEVSLLNESTNNGVRSLRLRITSPRQAPFVSVTLESETEVVGASVNGKPIEHSQMAAQSDPNRQWRLFYYGPPAEGIELNLDIRSSQPLKLRVMDQSFELPASLTASFKPRPDDKMPTAYPYNPYGDATMVSKTFAF